MPCVWVKAYEGSRRMRRRRRASPTVQPPVDHALQRRSAWLRLARERPRRAHDAAAMPHPARHRRRIRPRRCVDLPGHSSRGRLERVLRRGEFAVTAELNPPDSADPEDVYERARNLRGLGRRDQRHRRLGRALPHVERRHLRAADPHRLFAGDADLLPRLQPHRHPGRRARRGGARRRQHPLPDRRRRAVRRPSRRQAGLRPRLDLAARDHPQHARRGPVPVRPQDHRRRRASSSARPRTRSRRRTISARCGSPRRSPPARSSSRRNIASTCRCCSASWREARDLGLARAMLHPGRRRPARLGQGGALDARQRAGRAYPRRGHRAARGRGQTRRPRASASASR